MTSVQIFEHAIDIEAPAAIVEGCLTDRALMHQWLNPALRCEPIGEWSVERGARSEFIVQFPLGLWAPRLTNTVVERRSGLIVWQFTGFFNGNDRWECLPLETPGRTKLCNRFEFTIPNAIVAWGFQLVAAQWTQRDMQDQLQRIQCLAESLQERVP